MSGLLPQDAPGLSPGLSRKVLQQGAQIKDLCGISMTYHRLIRKSLFTLSTVAIINQESCSCLSASTSCFAARRAKSMSPVFSYTLKSMNLSSLEFFLSL